MFKILYIFFPFSLSFNFIPIFIVFQYERKQNLPDKQYADHSLKQSPSLPFGGQQKYLKCQLEKVKKKELLNQDVLDDTPFLVWVWGWENKGSDVKNK